MNTILFKIRRQENPKAQPYWDEFEVKLTEEMTVALALQQIQKRPLNAEGRIVSPVVWMNACQHIDCCVCLMLINGKPRPACATTVEGLLQPICLEPLTKFPVVKDLIVDRARIDQDIQRLQAWNQLDGYKKTNELCSRRVTDEQAVDASRCTSCGACLEACPQYHASSAFVGPMLLLSCQQHLQNARSAEHKREMIEVLASEGGVFDCCNVQNCQRVCPQKINITEAIGLLKRAVFKGTVKRFLG